MNHAMLISSERISQAVQEMAARIDEEPEDELLAVKVLKGAAIFSADLVRAMSTPIRLGYVTAASYATSFTPGPNLTVGSLDDLEVEGRSVLLIEDIIDTGRTLRRLTTGLTDAGASKVLTAVLIDKVERREESISPDFSGFEITTEFIYGYGLDWDQRYRELPYIAVANPD